MGVYGVPGQSNELLSIGGDGTAKYDWLILHKTHLTEYSIWKLKVVLRVLMVMTLLCDQQVSSQEVQVSSAIHLDIIV